MSDVHARKSALGLNKDDVTRTSLNFFGNERVAGTRKLSTMLSYFNAVSISAVTHSTPSYGDWEGDAIGSPLIVRRQCR